MEGLTTAFARPQLSVKPGDDYTQRESIAAAEDSMWLESLGIDSRRPIILLPHTVMKYSLGA